MKKKKRINVASRLLPVLFVFLLLSLQIFAQSDARKITGRITDTKTGLAIPGATITVKGHNAITDSAGKFTIMAQTGETLVITHVGYNTSDIKVGNGNTLNIELDIRSGTLDDIVVIGYGKVKRKDLTGDISSISGNELLKTQPTTFEQGLQGKVAGVIVQQISGQPGGAVSIQIHGISSITGSNSPLYVIDGVIIPPPSDPGDGSGSNPLNSINPSEIETIDILKDASATAIYGSQATNGVVVITTRRGSISAPQISYDGYLANQQLAKKLPTVNLQQFATVLNARGAVWGFDIRPQFANPQYLGTGTDWQKALFRNAPTENNTVAVSGGDARTQYMFSTTYFDQEGIALGSDFKRYSVRLNLDNKTTNWLKIGTSLQLVHIDESVNATASNVIQTALSMTPDISVKNPDGSYGGVTNTAGWVNAIANPVGLTAINTDEKHRNQVFGNVYAEVQFTKDLSLRNELSGNFDFNTNNTFTPAYAFGKDVNSISTASYSYGQNFYTVVRNYLTYNHHFTNYTLNALLGQEAQLSTFQNVAAGRSNFPSNDVQSISSGDATTATNSGTFGTGTAIESYFARINFTWNDKYLLTGNIRRDGSSVFPANNRWATDYSGAFSWRLSDEEFLKSVKEINELKLRVSYGLTNNQNIPGNTYTAQLTTAANGLSGNAQYQTNLPNPNVTWEQTNTGNVGLDGTFFNWKLNFSFNLYNRLTNGLLLQLPLPLYSGTTTGYSPGALNAPYVNIGSMSNKGFDLHIGITGFSNKTFIWKTDFTISHNANKVLSLGSGGNNANLSETSGISGQTDVWEKTVVGQPIGEFYGYIYDGIFAKASDFRTHALSANSAGIPYPVQQSGGIWYGDRKYKDINGDGIIDSRDETFLGSPIPKVQLGFGNSITFKGLDFYIFFSSNIGNKILNTLSVTQNNPQNNTNYFTSVLNYANVAEINPENGNASDVNNYYVTNPKTDIVGLRNDNTNYNTRPSNLYIENGTYLKCKNITLGYTFPEDVMKKAHLHTLRVYMSVVNAFTITKYTGMDPEIGSWNPLQAGWDYGYYPQPRMMTAGLNLKLSK